MNLINDNNLKSLEVNQVNANMDVVHGLINGSDTVIGERKAATISFERVLVGEEDLV